MLWYVFIYNTNVMENAHNKQKQNDGFLYIFLMFKAIKNKVFLRANRNSMMCSFNSDASSTRLYDMFHVCMAIH